MNSSESLGALQLEHYSTSFITVCIGKELWKESYLGAMKTFYRVTERYERANVDFRITLASHPFVFMRVIDDNRYVKRAFLEVDGPRFLDFWRLNSTPIEKEFANGCGNKWRQDRKFQSAEDGFAEGESNPVPLANVGFFESDDQNSRRFGFQDGITRTIWLLAHGATTFPIECNAEHAAALNKHIGSSTYGVKTIDALLKLKSLDQKSR